MAGDWIKMQKSLPRDPRVVRISSALKADRLRTVGGLLSAWCLFDEQTEDGILEGYTAELMDDIVGFQGLARAMESVGWLEIGDGFLVVPRFEEHNGQSAKRRAQDSNRKMSARKEDKCPQTKRTKSGPEKRREEKSNVPPNPQGGKAERKDNLPTTPQSIRISELFHRKPSTKWSDKEIASLRKIPRESLEELETVCRYTEAERLKGDAGRHRRDLATFLNNYTGELDRARGVPINGHGQQRTKRELTGADLSL
jgi:hypothetical protein